VVAFPYDPDRPDVAAVVRVGGERSPSGGEWARYAALRKLGEPGHRKPLRPVSLAVLGAVGGDDFWPETDVRIVRPDWTPTLKQFGADVTGHSSLLITTPGDSRRHHVLAGAALHSTRLSTAVRGFASRVLSMPALVPAERAKYVEGGLLPGLPQALLLVGLAAPTRRKDC
jgi:hypothetical protein